MKEWKLFLKLLIKCSILTVKVSGFTHSHYLKTACVFVCMKCLSGLMDLTIFSLIFFLQKSKQIKALFNSSDMGNLPV